MNLLKLNLKFSEYATCIFLQWKRTSRVPQKGEIRVQKFLFQLAYWFGLSSHINTLTNPTTFSSSQGRGYYSYFGKEIVNKSEITFSHPAHWFLYNRLTLGSDSIGFHLANKILIKETYFYLRKKQTNKKLDNPSNQRHSPQTAQSWIRLWEHWLLRHSTTNCTCMISSTLSHPVSQELV